MESKKVYNANTKRYVTKNGKTYNKLIKNGYFIENNKLYAPKIEPIKKTLSNILEPTLNHILLELSVQDLLSLYIIDKKIHTLLNDTSFLQLLSNKYNISYSRNFSEFLTNYNLHLVPYRYQYLYKLENNVEMPSETFLTQFVNGTQNINIETRIKAVEWISGDNKSNPLVFMLAVSLLDCYISKVNVGPSEMQLISNSCAYIAEITLLEYPSDIDDFVENSDNNFTKNKLINYVVKIITTLNGVMIRPSVCFYTMDDFDLWQFAKITYYDANLMIYKPSLIYEAMHYMLYGTFKIYTLDEIKVICHLMTKFIESSKDLPYENLTKYIKNIQNKIKFTCETGQTTPIKSSKFVYNNEWHIKETTPIKKVKKLGKGCYGNVHHVTIDNKAFAAKKSENHLDTSMMEIMILQHLINHPNIIALCHFDLSISGKYNQITSNLYMPLMNSELKELIEKDELNRSKFPIYFKQITLGIHYCHQHDIMIRDIKPENILYNKEEDTLKLIDFGISVPYASYRHVNMPSMASTLYYRAPEALLEDTDYSIKIDIWALGTVFCFMENKKMIFDKDNQIDMLYQIFQTLGTPTEQSWPGVTKLPDWRSNFPMWKSQNINNFVRHYSDIIGACLILDPKKRYNTQQLLSLLHTNYQV